MKKKIIIIVIIALVVGAGLFIFLDMKKDKELTRKKMSEVTSNYQTFKKLAGTFNTTRADLYSVVLNNIYYDDLAKNSDKYYAKFSEYEAEVDSITKTTKTLKSLCVGVYYPKITINNECNAYTTAYEAMYNYFVTDVKVYNKNITAYNTYAKEQNLTTTLKEYSTTKTKYIDYNNDGIYAGKES
jgi:flagellar basal body-associated protein FliL